MKNFIGLEDNTRIRESKQQHCTSTQDVTQGSRNLDWKQQREKGMMQTHNGTLCNHATCCNMFYVLALHILLISRSMTWNHDYGACMIMAYNNLCAVALISPTQTNRGEDRNRRKHKQTDMTISYCCCLALAMNIKRHDDDEHASILKNTMHIFLQNLGRKKNTNAELSPDSAIPYY